MRWLIYLILLGLTGCLGPSKPVWTEVPTAEELLNRLAVDAGQYFSLDGEAHVSLTTKDKYVSSQQFLSLQQPDFLRVDALTGFGQLIIQVASDGETLSVFLHTTVPGRFFRGPASDENISRFTRMPLAVRDFLPLLLYSPPIIAFQESRVEVSSKGLTLILHDGVREQQILFNRQLQLTGCRYYRDGKKSLVVEYSHFSGDNKFPYTIKVMVPQQQARVKLEFSELVLNQDIDKARFSLKKPENLLLEPLPE
jgi:outer membrane lipoprotein-sorting protein